MWSKPQLPEDLVTLTEEILYGKRFCAVYEPITILPARSVFTFQIKLFVVSIYYHIFKSFHTTSLLLYRLKMLMFSGGIKREKWHEMA